ncbi:hypothetical protein [Niastella populi]|nr:hypothetical protein [Niastella populi]
MLFKNNAGTSDHIKVLYEPKGDHPEFTAIGEMKKERGLAMPRK